MQLTMHPLNAYEHSYGRKNAYMVPCYKLFTYNLKTYVQWRKYLPHGRITIYYLTGVYLTYILNIN